MWISRLAPLVRPSTLRSRSLRSLPLLTSSSIPCAVFSSCATSLPLGRSPRTCSILQTAAASAGVTSASCVCELPTALGSSRHASNATSASSAEPSSSSSARSASKVINDNITEGQVLGFDERSINLVNSRVSGTLATFRYNNQVVEAQKVPLFTSTMPYVLNEDSWPVIGLVPGEGHYQNITEHSFGSLMIYTLTPVEVNPALNPVPRVNLSGEVYRVKDEKKVEYYRAEFLRVHPGSKDYVDSYEFFSLSPEQTTYVDPKEGKKVLTMEEYESAPVDPFAVTLRFLLPRMNQTRANELMRLCKIFANIEVKRAILTNVDRYGMEILAEPTERPLDAREDATYWSSLRLPFSTPISELAEFRDAFDQALTGNE